MTCSTGTPLLNAWVAIGFTAKDTGRAWNKWYSHEQNCLTCLQWSYQHRNPFLIHANQETLARIEQLKQLVMETA